MGESFDSHGDLNIFARQSDLHWEKFHPPVLFSLVEGGDLTIQHLLQEKEAEP